MDPNITTAETVLGAVLMYPHLWPSAADRLTEDHFPREIHRQTLREIRKVAESGASWDAEVVILGIIDAGEEEKYGGIAYLSSLPEKAPLTDCNLDFYLDRLDKERRLRGLRDIGERLIKPEGDPAELQADVEARLRALAPPDSVAWVDGAGIAQGTMERLQTRIDEKRRGIEPGWSTGIGSLDRLTGGLRPKQVWTVGGRPAMGKTAFLMQLLLHQARKGRKTAFMSLEMSIEALGERTLAHISGISAEAIREGNISPGDWDELNRAAEMLHAWPIHVDERPASAGEIVTRVRQRAIAVSGMDVVGVDYIQQLGEERGVRYNRSDERIGAALRILQAMAKIQGVALIQLSQVKREVESRAKDKHPMMSDFAEAATIEAVSDYAIMLMRPEYYDENDRKGEIDLDVVKARHGRTGRIAARWDGARQTICDFDRQHDVF